MRSKKIVLLALLALSVAVANGQEGPIDAQKPVGGDRDAHGCIPSAGYTWSEIKHKCVHLWEAATPLYPVGGGTLVTYVILSDDKKSVETFMPSGSPFIMKMSKPNTYSYKKFVLTTAGSIDLKENGEILFSTRKYEVAPSKNNLTVNHLEVEATPGQVTFSQNDHTIFYYNQQTKKGLIKINGKEYATSDYKFVTDTYIITGDGISITAPKCKYKKNNGEDCMYGSFNEVVVKLGTQKLTLNHVQVQDCPKY